MDKGRERQKERIQEKEINEIQKGEIQKKEVQKEGMFKEGTGDENLAFRYLYGFAILFVVLSHCDGGGVEMLSNWMHFGAFHLGIFVFGSGYFFREEKLKTPLLYLWSKIKRLLIPLWCWNLFYGLVLTLLRGIGFAFGEPLTLKGILLFPVNSENLYILNMGSWFILPFFCVQILYGAGKVLLDFCGKPKLTDRLLQAAFIIAGFAGVYFAGHGYHEYALYPVFRILYFMPFYAFGMLYRDFLEQAFSKIPAVLYLGACLLISLLLNAHFGRAVYAIPSSCDYPFGMWATYLAGALGILFWLRTSMILSGFEKRCIPLLTMGRSTWDIMFHQFAGIMAVKAVFAAGSRFLGIFQDFDFAAFSGDIWYLYRPGGMQEFALLYVLGAVGVSIAIKALLKKGKMQWEKTVKARGFLLAQLPWEKKANC